VVAAAHERLVPYDTPVDAVLPGGALTIRVHEGDSSLVMTGPACFVFRGETV